MTTTQLTSTSTGPLSTRQKVGLGIAGFLCAANVVSVFFPTPDGEVGPPLSILAIGTALGLVGLMAAVLAWRGSRVALRVTAGCIVVAAITGLPAFFVDVPMGIKMLVGVSVLVTVAALVLMFSPAPRSGAVVD